jgi:yersiniabactin nonribosomal peptide synthetase
VVIEQQGSAEASVNMSLFSYQEVRMQVKTMLPVPIEFDDDDNLIELGLDSLKIMRIVNEWRRAGSVVTFAELIEAPRLSDWWSLLQKSNTGFPVVSEVAAENETSGDVNEPFLLTDVQHAYWIGRRDDQPLGGVGCHAYLEIDGKRVEPQRLESAWTQLFTHHSMLRARFLDNGQQEVLDTPFSKALLVHDLRLYPESELTLKLKRIRNRLSHRRLSVDKGEVIGIELSLLPDGCTRLHFDIDLLVADVQSLQIIIRDLAAAYGRGCPPAAPINWSFAKYLKQEERRQSLDKERAGQYWNQRLLTLPAAPGLPLKEKPEAIRSPVFKRRNYIVKSTDWTILQKRSAAHQVTPAMALLTAYAEVLDRWSTKSQFLINIPLFDRQTGEAGIEDVVADFTNLLLLAVDCSFPQSFLERARGVQAQFHKDVANASFSGIQLQRDMARVRHGERMFAPVVFACNLGTPLINAECRETLGKFTYMISQTPQVWLDFQIYEMDDGLLLAWDAVDALFPDGLIDQMFTAYTQFIEWLVADGNDWQSSLNVLPAAHQQRRDRDVELSIPQSTQCLHTSFFDFAAANPQQTALIDSHSNTHLTYGELSRHALQVAALLKEHGVMQGDPVAVTLPRGIEQIAAVFGILALGACYAPVSVEQPSVRRDRIHKKAAIRYALTNYEQAQTIAWPADAVVLDIANTANTTALAGPVEVSPEQLAYIIFTSGSTGEPKGVEISHCAAWNTIAEINRRYNVNATDRILAVSALDFDLSVYDIFGLLSVGGSLVLITEDTRRDAAHWLKLLNKYQVTIWNSVPVLLDMLLVVAESEQQKTLPLRLSMLSGDWIGLDIPTRLHSVAEHCHLIAMGGATEASIWSNFFDVTLPLPAHWTSIPYGRSLANQAYRVVDSKGRDCPDWVAGELWIGGAGVAQGYRGDSKLTAERFVEWNASRWYRTGDLGRYLPDGNIEFLGREDFQVKIRGHRIELGEIEAALLRCPGVCEGAVVAIGKPRGDKRLMGYVVLEGSASHDTDELRRFLEQKLPKYMVPSSLITLDTMLLTPNGKIDRSALIAQAEGAEIKPEQRFVAPSSFLEKTIAEIWADLLQKEKVGIHDNFFDLGGNSLLATQLLTKLRKNFKKEIPSVRVFEYPSVSAFAQYLGKEGPHTPVGLQSAERGKRRRQVVLRMPRHNANDKMGQS